MNRSDSPQLPTSVMITLIVCLTLIVLGTCLAAVAIIGHMS